MTFYRWLLKNCIKDDDHIGDLARDVKRDPGAPTKGGFKEWKDHLGGTAALEALEDAWIEYLNENTQRKTGK